jgi:hypothetical protein
MFICRALPWLTVIFILGAEGATADEPTAQPPRWEQLLGCLPEDTETIVVSQSAYEMPKWAEGKRSSPLEEQRQFGEIVRMLPYMPLFDDKSEFLGKDLQGLKVLCALEGSRRFSSPQGLGLMPYEGCHIFQFDATAEEPLKKAFAKWLEVAQKKIELAGQQVLVHSVTQEDDVWTWHICQPRSGILLCATNATFLEQTLKRMNGNEKKRALPPDLPEWKQVDIKARVWAIRHYRKETAEQDPSSPLRGKAAANVPDADAIGFVFSYDSGDTAKARYLSGAKNATEIATQGWRHPSEGLAPEFKQSAPGVVEISAPIGNERSGGMFFFVLLAYLGHAVYV